MRSLSHASKHIFAKNLSLSHPAYHTSAANEDSEYANLVSYQLGPANSGLIDNRRPKESFTLKPLSKDTSARILTIQPSSTKTAPVVLDVEEIDLAGSYEPFVAISHVWGSTPKYDRFAICNGRLKCITARVDSLLHRIRNKISENSRYRHWNRIWLDTLCIDQADNAIARFEKNHQVSMMHKIFGDAQEVVVDLGAVDKYTHHLPAAMQDIMLLKEKAFDDEYCKDILGFQSSVKVEPEEARRIRRSLEACSRLLDKQWMCRIWAIQEYALARKSTFLSGPIVIDGDLLKEVGNLASEANVRGISHLSTLFSRFRRSLALNKLPRLAAVREQGLASIRKLSFAESLGLGWHHECTDERDTVYALRALVDYGGSPLKVDYNEPSRLLARRVSRKLVELQSFEALLSGARGLSEAPGDREPSWSFLMRPSIKFVGEERHWILSGMPNRCRAGGSPETSNASPTLRFSTEDQLDATVSHISSVSVVSEKFPKIPLYGSSSSLPIEHVYAHNTERMVHTRAVILDTWLRHIIPQLNRGRKTKHLHRRSGIVWRTITHRHNSVEIDTQHRNIRLNIDHLLMLTDMSVKGLEVLGYQRLAQSTLRRDIRALDEAMLKRHLLNAELLKKPQEWIDEVHHEFDLLGDPRKKGVARLLSKARAISARKGLGTNLSQDQMLKQVALNNYLVNEAFDVRKVRPMDSLKMLDRRLVVLQDGRIASVPHLTDVGDTIVVFRGVSVPYVMRKVGEAFKIVGMAYVDNIMLGGAVNDETEWQTIQIT